MKYKSNRTMFNFLFWTTFVIIIIITLAQLAFYAWAAVTVVNEVETNGGLVNTISELVKLFKQ